MSGYHCKGPSSRDETPKKEKNESLMKDCRRVASLLHEGFLGGPGGMVPHRSQRLKNAITSSSSSLFFSPVLSSVLFSCDYHTFRDFPCIIASKVLCPHRFPQISFCYSRKQGYTATRQTSLILQPPKHLMLVTDKSTRQFLDLTPQTSFVATPQNYLAYLHSLFLWCWRTASP